MDAEGYGHIWLELEPSNQVGFEFVEARLSVVRCPVSVSLPAEKR